MLTTLAKILPPPLEPQETGTADLWPQVETELQLPMPPDYRDFVGRYGTGCIDDFLWVDTPFTRLRGLQLRLRSASQLEAFRVLKETASPDMVPYPVFPERGGVFPWGGTDNGDVLCWLTTGPPSDWTVAINESRGPMWEEYDCSMVEFLVKLLSREIRSDLLPEGFPSASPQFRVVTSVEGYLRK